jgi:translation initiation factor 1A
MKKKSKQFIPIIKRARTPRHGQLYAVVREMSGGSRMQAVCEDGYTRMIRIGGKFKRRMWCRRDDLIIIKPWVVQENEKADLVYRYLPAERNWLIRNGKVPEELNIW